MSRIKVTSNLKNFKNDNHISDNLMGDADVLTLPPSFFLVNRIFYNFFWERATVVSFNKEPETASCGSHS